MNKLFICYYFMHDHIKPLPFSEQINCFIIYRMVLKYYWLLVYYCQYTQLTFNFSGEKILFQFSWRFFFLQIMSCLPWKQTLYKKKKKMEEVYVTFCVWLKKSLYCIYRPLNKIRWICVLFSLMCLLQRDYLLFTFLSPSKGGWLTVTFDVFVLFACILLLPWIHSILYSTCNIQTFDPTNYTFEWWIFL